MLDYPVIVIDLDTTPIKIKKESFLAPKPSRRN